MRLTSDRRRREQTVVPMINVAFLLLVFFLMTAVLTPDGPLDITVPTAESEAEGEGVLVSVDAAGALARGTLRGDAVFDGLAGQSVQVRVDASVPGAELARLLGRLASAGVVDVSVVTARP